MSRQLKALKAEQFKKGQQLFSLHSQERELTSEINGSNAQKRNLSHKLRKLDEKVQSVLCCRCWVEQKQSWYAVPAWLVTIIRLMHWEGPALHGDLDAFQGHQHTSNSQMASTRPEALKCYRPACVEVANPRHRL